MRIKIENIKSKTDFINWLLNVKYLNTYMTIQHSDLDIKNKEQYKVLIEADLIDIEEHELSKCWKYFEDKTKEEENYTFTHFEIYLNEEDTNYYSTQDSWTLDEAIMLLLDINPSKIIKKNMFDSPDYETQFKYSHFKREYDKIHNSLKNSIESDKILYRTSDPRLTLQMAKQGFSFDPLFNPIDIIGWATKKKIDIPGELEKSVKDYNNYPDWEARCKTLKEENKKLENKVEEQQEEIDKLREKPKKLHHNSEGAYQRSFIGTLALLYLDKNKADLKISNIKTQLDKVLDKPLDDETITEKITSSIRHLPKETIERLPSLFKKLKYGLK